MPEEVEPNIPTLSVNTLLIARTFIAEQKATSGPVARALATALEELDGAIEYAKAVDKLVAEEAAEVEPTEEETGG